MTIEQAIEYATSGQSSGGPITQDALSVLAGAAQGRRRLLDACERLVKADADYGELSRDFMCGRIEANAMGCAHKERKSAFDALVAAIKSMGGLTE